MYLGVSGDQLLAMVPCLALSLLVLPSESLPSHPCADEVSDEESRWPAGARATSSHARFSIEIPRLPIHFTGTGDLTAALLLAWSHRLPHRFASVVEHAIASVQGVCSITLRKAGDSTASRELRVVESKAFLEAPVISLTITPIV